MSTNPLVALRVALPGQPNLREMSERLDCSVAYFHNFERGDALMSDEKLAAYAKVVRLGVTEIKRRFWSVAIERAEGRRALAREELKKLGVSDPSVKRNRKSA